MRAVLLAGGKGTRLKPYTTLIPKPLVPIGNEYSILEIVISQLSSHGFSHITICVNHMAELIKSFLGDGRRYGVQIDYSVEDEPLSTIGPLTLIENLPDDFLVMNGDILCDLDYGSFLHEHHAMGNDVTVCTFPREVSVDYGVIELSNSGHITGFVEKPRYRYEVSMGIYCMKRSVVRSLPKGKPYGFDDLMIDGIKNKKLYSAKRYHGFWLDLGRPEDYDYCNSNYEEIKALLKIK